MEVDKDVDFLYGVQNKLFSVGAYLAIDMSVSKLGSACVITKEDVLKIEHEIDELDDLLPPLHAFVLPGGERGAAICHVCRTVCRRAERAILSLVANYQISEDLLAYMNRLSDYFFVLCRKINFEAGKDEIFWDNSCK